MVGFCEPMRFPPHFMYDAEPQADTAMVGREMGKAACGLAESPTRDLDSQVRSSAFESRAKIRSLIRIQ